MAVAVVELGSGRNNCEGGYGTSYLVQSDEGLYCDLHLPVDDGPLKRSAEPELHRQYSEPHDASPARWKLGDQQCPGRVWECASARHLCKQWSNAVRPVRSLPNCCQSNHRFQRENKARIYNSHSYGPGYTSSHHHSYNRGGDCAALGHCLLRGWDV